MDMERSWSGLVRFFFAFFFAFSLDGRPVTLHEFHEADVVWKEEKFVGKEEELTEYSNRPYCSRNPRRSHQHRRRSIRWRVISSREIPFVFAYQDRFQHNNQFMEGVWYIKGYNV